MNNQYQRKFRAKQHQPIVAEPTRRHRQSRKKHSFFGTLLMIIGAGTLLVLLMRYVIVPILVMLPRWLGGTL